MSTGMLLDGPFGTEAIDSSGEILDVEGADITSLEKDGVINWEHRGDDAPGASPLDIIGKVVFAKKIFGLSDCDDDRQREYWKQIKLPFIYGIARLYDGAGHPGAIAAAAQIRDAVANGEPPIIRWSVEGSTLEKKGNVLKRSVIRRVAATIKPCNKSAVSGIISDPNAPKGFDKNPGEVKRDEMDDIIDRLALKEHGDPMYERLGGGYEASYVEFDSMQKMLEAGNYNAAPSSLVGGSALQVESLSSRKRKIEDLTKQAKAAIRDWNKLDPVKPFLKHRLPEASDAFIDRFAELAEDWKLKKDEHEAPHAAVQAHAKKKAKASPMQAAVKEVRKPTTAAEDEVDEVGGGPLSIRGKPIPENPNITAPHFDENTGVLHTPRGSFPMYIPSRDPDPRARESFHNIMQDPKVNAFHNYATENWAKMNKLMKHGKLPPEAVMHAVLFSQLSPNTPVPVQEMMYGHLVDHMKQTGIDARDPKFGATKEGWMGRDTKDTFPTQSRSHFQKLQDQLRLKMDSKHTGRVKGDIASFMLANNKWKNMEQYHTLHDGLMKLLAHHKDDARAAAADLMHHKRKADLHEAKRQRGLAAGKEDIGEYTEGPAVPGLAPKTARYTLGMLGGGNIHVPDTHFARYLFGLEKGNPQHGKPGDNKTIAYIKNLLWNENNSHVLDGIDRYYAKHHDAVKHMMEHPQFKHLFDGNPENAVFPAFWKNWVSIVPHEKARGLNSPRAFNEVTDHRPFWETTAPFVDKALKSEADDDGWALAQQTAAQHAQWVEQYGEGPAMMLYYTHLVPQLLARYTGGDEGVPGSADNQNWYPDENAAEFESPLDLSPTEGDERAYGEHPHVQPAHLDFQKDEQQSPSHGQSESQHPAVSGGHYAILTGEAPRFPVSTHGENDTLERELTQRGMKFEKVLGSYGGGKENSYLVHEPNLHHILDLGRRYGQESVLYAKGGKGNLIYTHGPNAGHMHELPSVKTFAHPPEDNYTTLFGAGKNGEHLHFSWNADWDRLHPVQPLLDQEKPQPQPKLPTADEQLAMKFEYLVTELTLNLRKAAGEEPAKEPDHEQEVHFHGNLVKPGLAVRHMDGKKFHVLHQRDTGGVVAIPEEKFSSSPHPRDAQFLPADSFSLVKPHSSRAKPSIINALTHGDWTFNRRPEQHDLIHGADMSLDPVGKPKSAMSESKHGDVSEWRKMGGGKIAYVKPQGDVMDGVSEAKREAVYHNIAKDFFGMGNYLPNVAYFKHPTTGEEMAALERVDGEHIHTKRGPEGGRLPVGPHADHLQRLGSTGELDKLALMNTVLANNDRHQHNYMMTKDGLRLIDHGLSLSPGHSIEEMGEQYMPHYIRMYDNMHGADGEHEPVHPEAHRWLMGLDPDVLHQQLMSHKLPKGFADESRHRLVSIQNALRANPMLGRDKAHRAFWDKTVADISPSKHPTKA